jgi:hypothetical protein
MSMQALSDVGDRIISCGTWLARSPDLTPCDFFVGLFEGQSLREQPPRTASKGKSEPLPPMRGICTCRGTAFSTPPVICEVLTT